MKKLIQLMTTITLIISSYNIFVPTPISAEVEEPLLTSTEEHVKLTLNNAGEKEEQLPDQKVLTEEEKLLARLVHAEAKGEPYDGKVAVATVVLNRVEHDQFPDTIKEVIYDKNAFAPVQNGAIHEPADKEALKAVQEALKEQENDDELLYFYNPETATSDWIFTRKVVKTIGNHAFAI